MERSGVTTAQAATLIGSAIPLLARADVEMLIDRMIDRLDEYDGDPDEEDDDIPEGDDDAEESH